jgi:sigma-E factor negative regulatory protein RseB
LNIRGDVNFIFTRAARSQLSLAVSGVWLFLLVSLLSQLTHAQETRSAEEWIKSMHDAGVHATYRGTFMFSRGDMSSSMRIVHRFHEGQEQERLTQLDGEMGEILRRGEKVMCLVNGQRLIQLDKPQYDSPSQSVFAQFMPGHDYYDLAKDGYERVVNRSSVRLSINAKDTIRYSYRLWLDEASGLLLKAQIIGLNSEVLEHFQFSMIEIPATVEDAEFEFGMDAEKITHESIPMSRPDDRWPEQLAWKLSWVPSGFMSVDGRASARNVMLFSDGLASYSVFVEKKKANALPGGASLIGATVAYVAEFEYQSHTYSVTVMGEIPPMTAMKIAKGVEPVMMPSAGDE